MVKHLLVTNDFPPKVGGIQSYLYELWRRLDPKSFVVVTTPHQNADGFDAQQEFEIIRVPQKVLMPTASFARRISEIAQEHQVSFIVWDPALPIGMLAPKAGFPYGVILHGAELAVPSRLPFTFGKLTKVLSGARFVITAGQYPRSELERLFVRAKRPLPEIFEIPPGVDTIRFGPPSKEMRASYRESLGIREDDFLISSVSRLVPRKGMDTLIGAVGLLKHAHPELKVIIAGSGRDERRLSRMIKRRKVSVRLFGRVDEEDLPDLLGASDGFAMLCRNRWAGLEQEGFGIVFLEASSCGLPVIAGYSGGSTESVTHEQTGFVVYQPKSPRKAAEAISMLISNVELREQMGRNGRQRALDEFSYARLSEKLGKCLGSIS
ncbi:MAG: glycosyltransferase family 4 protein [Acidimicrobiaceae bacterium]|nr:glycosyltransferase family 4 protein [Acidimicrobiaceae bacterium]